MRGSGLRVRTGLAVGNGHLQRIGHQPVGLLACKSKGELRRVSEQTVVAQIRIRRDEQYLVRLVEAGLVAFVPP